MFSPFVPFLCSIENLVALEEPWSASKQKLSNASFQHGVLESRLTWMSSEASVRVWMAAIHAGMTETADGECVDNIGIEMKGCRFFSS
jgi:hypothetical protein